MDTDARLLIFAKAPDPGHCKTRLAPFLGAVGAATLHAGLVRRSVHIFSGQDLCPTELWCTPDTGHPFFHQLHDLYKIPLHTQADGDIGVKMALAVKQRLRDHSKAIIMGTDCPTMTLEHLTAVLDDLDNEYDASIIPAEDGGYVMIGLRRFNMALFSDIDWGTHRVMQQTSDRLNHLGWKWRQHQPLWDLDRKDDYLRLCKQGIQI